MAFLRNENLPNTGIILAFPTCIYQGQYPDYKKFNPILEKRLYKLKNEDTITNELSKNHYGLGWTSYHACDGNYTSKYNIENMDIFDPLKEFIWQSILDYNKFVGFDPINMETTRLGVVWGNINGKYSYHEQHIHPNSFLSGVYYVNAPKGSGNINFIDPRNSIRSVEMEPNREQPLTDPLRRVIEVEPQDGMLLLFPSWLGHEVQQNLTENDRVSIAFNLIPDYIKIANRAKNGSTE